MLLALWPSLFGLNAVRTRQVHERKTIERPIDDVPVVYAVEPSIPVIMSDALIVGKQRTDDYDAMAIILAMIR